MAIVVHTLIVLYFTQIIKISEYPGLTINFMTKKTYSSVLEENKQLKKEVEALKRQLREKLQKNNTFSGEKSADF